jgi:hypothetical protein
MGQPKNGKQGGTSKSNPKGTSKSNPKGDKSRKKEENKKNIRILGIAILIFSFVWSIIAGFLSVTAGKTIASNPQMLYGMPPSPF